MNKIKTHRLGDLQLRIMRVLWKKTEATVSEVHGALSQKKELAYTTIATMLRKMEGRGLVKHRLEERKFIYTPAVKEEAITRNMAADLVDRLFQGSLSSMVHHLLTSRDVAPDELEKIEKMISERKKMK